MLVGRLAFTDDRRGARDQISARVGLMPERDRCAREEPPRERRQLALRIAQAIELLEHPRDPVEPGVH